MDDLAFGTGAFEFAPWSTPIENASIKVLEVTYRPYERLKEDRVASNILFRPLDKNTLTILLGAEDDEIYRVVFPAVSAFRVLDEAGLMQLWHMTKELGGRPARTTFRVRNHLWSEESIYSFIHADDGWSFIIASDSDCVEIVADTPPRITREG